MEKPNKMDDLGGVFPTIFGKHPYRHRTILPGPSMSWTWLSGPMPFCLSPTRLGCYVPKRWLGNHAGECRIDLNLT